MDVTVVADPARRRSWPRRLAFAGVAGTVTLVLAELGLRAALFCDWDLFARLRDPNQFADWYSEDAYWKLQYRFGTRFPPPADPHPVLGWTGHFSREELIHDDTERVGARRPVLLYGDSFAMCTSHTECFEDILNADEEFSRDHYLLNYGVGGFGVDQILLLLQRSLDHHQNPFVVLSLMTLDLDRCVLSVRTGQKPRFHLEAGELALEQVSIEPDAEAFYRQSPIGIRSFLYRRLLYGGTLPTSISARLRGVSARNESKKRLNTKIILGMIDEVTRRGLDYCFIVFHPSTTLGLPDERTDWRDPFLRELLTEHRVPFIWSKELVPRSTGGEQVDVSLYIDSEDGHPTTLFNRIVAERIKREALGE